MTDISPEDVVRNYWTQFGPTFDDAVTSSRRWLHEDLELISFMTPDNPITKLDTMLEDLERARTDAGVHGYVVELPNIAAKGNVVFAERHETLLDKDGNPVNVFDVVGVFEVEDGKIRRFTDYFFDTRQMAGGWNDGDHTIG
jgi:limonene-1,2-epoxide hydrolase